jgi:hypothetical protein
VPPPTLAVANGVTAPANGVKHWLIDRATNEHSYWLVLHMRLLLGLYFGLWYVVFALQRQYHPLTTYNISNPK